MDTAMQRIKDHIKGNIVGSKIYLLAEHDSFDQWTTVKFFMVHGGIDKNDPHIVCITSEIATIMGWDKPGPSIIFEDDDDGRRVFLFGKVEEISGVLFGNIKYLKAIFM